MSESVRGVWASRNMFWMILTDSLFFFDLVLCATLYLVLVMFDTSTWHFFSYRLCFDVATVPTGNPEVPKESSQKHGVIKVWAQGIENTRKYWPRIYTNQRAVILRPKTQNVFCHTQEGLMKEQRRSSCGAKNKGGLFSKVWSVCMIYIFNKLCRFWRVTSPTIYLMCFFLVSRSDLTCLWLCVRMGHPHETVTEEGPWPDWYARFSPP